MNVFIMTKKTKTLTKQYLIYLLRWQLSTPLLALSIFIFTIYTNEFVATIIANLIGGLIFFWIDKLIFNHNK